MPMIRGLIRGLAAVLAIAALLFAQLAVSAFACPAMGGEPCPDLNANLCEQHCDYGHASFDRSPPAAPAAPALVSSFRVAPLEPAGEAPVRRMLAAIPPAGPAPPLIGFTVLRI